MAIGQGTGYVSKNGKIARKVIGGLVSSISIGTPLATLIAYYIAKLDPTAPAPIQAAWMAVVGGLIVALSGAIGAILTAPDGNDLPVIDPENPPPIDEIP